MIISSGRQFIFTHMPKTGGTSLTLALEDRAMKDDLLIGDTPKAKKRRKRLDGLSSAGRLWKHSTLADVEGVITRDQMKDWFVLSVVRNPWDRMVSYYHWLQSQRFEHQAVALAQSLDFKTFAQHSHTVASLNAAPVSYYTTDSAGQDHATLVARLETLDDDLAPFWEHVGFRLDLPRVNASARKTDYREYYDATTVDAVSDACGEDIARFGYCFEPTP